MGKYNKIINHCTLLIGTYVICNFFFQIKIQSYIIDDTDIIKYNTYVHIIMIDFHEYEPLNFICYNL